MSALLKNLERLQKFDFYIKKEITGDANSFARKLGMSRSAFYDFLDQVKLLGAEISYCPNRKSYYYAKPWHLHIGTDTQAKTYGGSAMQPTSVLAHMVEFSTFKKINWPCPEIPDRPSIL